MDGDNQAERDARFMITRSAVCRILLLEENMRLHVLTHDECYGDLSTATAFLFAF
jgi:hypothetical protein